MAKSSPRFANWQICAALKFSVERRSPATLALNHAAIAGRSPAIPNNLDNRTNNPVRRINHMVADFGMRHIHAAIELSIQIIPPPMPVPTVT